MLFGVDGEALAEVDLDGEPLQVVLPRPSGTEACTWAFLDEWRYMFPFALPEEQRDYWVNRLNDPGDALSYRALRPIAFRLAEQVYGVPWWAAHRILAEVWPQCLGYKAWCVSNAFKPDEEPADRIIASAVAFVSSQWDDETQGKSWHQRTFMPPVGVKI